jgi:hypothetical protein
MIKPEPFANVRLIALAIEIDNNPYIQFTIKDFPGAYELKENSQADIALIKSCGSLIYVIDAQ